MPLFFFCSTPFIRLNFPFSLFAFYYHHARVQRYFNDKKNQSEVCPLLPNLPGIMSLPPPNHGIIQTEKEGLFSSSFYTPRLCLLPQSTLRTQTCPNRNTFNRGMHTLKFTLPHKIPHRLPICILLPSSRFGASPFYRVNHNSTRQNNRLAKKIFAKRTHLRS